MPFKSSPNQGARIVPERAITCNTLNLKKVSQGNSRRGAGNAKIAAEDIVGAIDESLTNSTCIQILRAPLRLSASARNFFRKT